MSDQTSIKVTHRREREMTKTSKQTWPLPAVDVNRLVRRFCRMLKSDAARLTSPLGKTIFLIIGENRNTKDDEGQWIDQDGKVRNWDYVRESCVASGDTVDELIASAKHYKRLQGMTWEQYFRQPNKTFITMPRPITSFRSFIN